MTSKNYSEYILDNLSTASALLETWPSVYRRNRYERLLEKGDKKEWYRIETYNPATKESVTEFIKQVEKEELTRGECKIEFLDGEDGMCAYWETTVPITDEERKEAEDWLAANPKPEESKTIKWRRNVPFTTPEN